MTTYEEVRKVLLEVYYKFNDEILALGLDKRGEHNLEKNNAFFYRKELGNFVLDISLANINEWDYDINYLILDEFMLSIDLYKKDGDKTIIKFLYFKSAECEEILNMFKSIVSDLLHYMEKISLFEDVSSKFLDYKRIEKMRL